MVYIFLANGFEEIEALTQVDYLRRAGIDIYTVGVEDECVVGAHDIPVLCDMTMDDVRIDKDELEMIILPGGLGGVDGMKKHPGVTALISYCAKKEIYIAAICAAPTILSDLKLLGGKRATCYPSMQKELCGCKIGEERVVVDGKIITSIAAGASEEFALELIRVLRGQEVSEKVKSGIYAR